MREGRLIVKEDCSATSCKKYFVILHNENVICLICQNAIAGMKEYNIKRHYWTKHPAKFDGIEVQFQYDEIEQLKKSLSKHEVFHSYEKDFELVRALCLRISI